MNRDVRSVDQSGDSHRDQYHSAPDKMRRVDEGDCKRMCTRVPVSESSDDPSYFWVVCEAHTSCHHCHNQIHHPHNV